MVLIAVFLAKILDPIGGIIALILGYLFGRPSGIILAALIGAGVAELVLSAFQATRYFSPLLFGVGVVALAVWAGIGYALSRKFGKAS